MHALVKAFSNVRAVLVAAGSAPACCACSTRAGSAGRRAADRSGTRARSSPRPCGPLRFVASGAGPARPRTAPPTPQDREHRRPVLRSSPRVIASLAAVRMRGSRVISEVAVSVGGALARHRPGQALEDADGVAGERRRVDVLAVGLTTTELAPSSARPRRQPGGASDQASRRARLLCDRARVGVAVEHVQRTGDVWRPRTRWHRRGRWPALGSPELAGQRTADRQQIDDTGGGAAELRELPVSTPG